MFGRIQLLMITLALPGLLALGAPVPEPHDDKGKESGADRPVNGEPAMVGIEREGLPVWAVGRLTAYRPDVDSTTAGVECAGPVFWGYVSRGQMSFEEENGFTHYPKDFELHVIRNHKREKLDLGRIEAALQKPGSNITSVRYLGRGSLVAVRVTHANRWHDAYLMDAAKGTPFMEKEIGAVLEKGEKIDSDPVVSSDGRSMTVLVHDGRYAPRGFLVVDLEKRMVRRRGGASHNLRWVSSDGEIVMAEDDKGRVITSADGRRFPPRGAEFSISNQIVIPDVAEKFLGLFLKDKNGTRFSRISLPNFKILSSYPVPETPKGYLEHWPVPLWDGRFFAFRHAREDDQWGLVESETGKVVRVSDGPPGTMHAICGARPGALAFDTFTPTGPHFPGGTVGKTFVDPEKFLAHLAGRSEGTVERLARDLRSKDTVAAYKAILEARRRGLAANGEIAAAKYDGAALTEKDLEFLKGLRDGLAADTFVERQRTSTDAMALMDRATEAVFRESVVPLLEKLTRDGDLEVRHRAQVLLRQWKESGKVSPQVVKERLALLSGN